MTHNSQLNQTQEKRLLHILFFIFGFGIMAWVPRFPELKANLGLSNGAFGTILTTGTIGAVLALLTAGQIVHTVGILKVYLLATVITYTSIALIVHVHSVVAFTVLNIGIAFGVMTTHVAINTQGFHIQERSGESVVTSASGYWSAGALSTALLSGFLVGRVGFSLHIGTVALICTAISIAAIFRLKPVLVQANQDKDAIYGARDIFKSFHIDWPVSIGMATAIYLEGAVTDWATIFTKERLDIQSGLSAVPYIFFTLTMIFGRVATSKILRGRRLDVAARQAAIFAGVGFGGFITIATLLPESAKWYSYGLFLVGFAIGGLGSSFLAPSFTSAAGRRSPHPNSVAVGQFGVLNAIFTMLFKWVVAGVIGITGSIALGLMIPAALIIIASFFTFVLKVEEKS